MTAAPPPAGPSPLSTISIETSGHVATVWLDRPDKLNAMSTEMWEELPEAMARVGQDPAVRAVVVAGRGRAFSVGIDLALLAQLTQGGAGSEASRKHELYEQVKRMQWTMTSIEQCPKPVIAAVHGHCLGGGMDLITACDIRLASADAIFSVRETKLAMVADVGTIQRLPRLVAPGHVAELLYTGKDIDAARAKAIGLVNEVYEDSETLLKAAWELAGEIAANSPLAVQGIKQVLAAGEGRTVAEALDYVALYSAAFIESRDLGEAVAAFFEKRSPEFTGE